MKKTRPLFALFIAFSLLVGGVAAPVSFVYADEISSEDITDDNQNNEDQNHALVKSAGANGADPSSGEAGDDGGEDPSDDGAEDDSGTTGEKSDIDTVDDPLASDVGSDAATDEPSNVGADYGANEGGDTGSGRKAADASGVSEPDAAGSGEPSTTTDNPGTKDGTDDSSGLDSGKSAGKAEGSDGPSVSQDSADSDTITAIDPPEQGELTLDYKTSLEILFEDFPKKITIHKGDGKEEIEAKWVCRDDYNENLEEYVFVPDMEEYKLAPELELPTVTVRFTEEETGPVSGYLGENLEYDVPLAGSRRGLLRKSGLPSSYSTYDEGKLPAVRRQSPYGTCWAFSLMGAVEADLIHDGTEGTDVDLSELHLAYYTSHDYDDGKDCHTDTVEFRSSDGYGYLDNGGNTVQAYRYLSNYVGAVQESSVRYSQGYDYDPGPGSAVTMNYVQIRNAYEISPSDTDNIKSAIMEHGGVAASYYETNGPNEFNSDNSAYYSTGKWYSNHAVMLVGWDDDFSREKFNASKRPSSNGAWLVRNSWGQNGFGHSGYFWLSYEDSGFINSDCVVAIDAELSEDMYDHCYAYDAQPIWDAVYYAGSGDTIRQTYDVDAGETIRAVSFEIGTANVTADVTVTDKETEDSIHTTCRTTYAGFHTAEFSEGLDIINDSEIEVAITYTADDGGSVIIVAENTGARGGFGDLYYTGVCDRGFRIGDGTYVYPYDARMNLYTDDYNGSSSGIALKDGPDSAHWKETIQLELTDDSIVTDETSLTWTSSNERVATVDNKGLVTMGPYKGSARIKGEYTTDGGKRYVWRTVTVEPYHVTYMNLPADTFQNGMSDVFYPGDSRNDGLFNAMRTSGYYVSAWYENASLSGSAISWHPTVCRDLVLYPKWTEMYLFIMYYVPNANLNGYNTFTRKSIKSQVGASKLPYTLPGATGCECNPNDFTTEYNKTHAPKAFSYWSWDAAGRNKATQITSDILNITYSGGAYYLNLDAYLYPQYKETGQNVPVTGITLNKNSLSLTPGQSYKLNATATPVNATNKTITWSSSNSSIARVDASGNVTAVGSGTATITARSVNGKTATCKVAVTVPNVSVSYRTHVQNVGWQDWRRDGAVSGTSGKALRLEGININLSNKKYSGGIRYKTHVQNIGWQDWRYDGAMSGTSGQALRLEAINIELYGEMAKYYDIYYRVHAQDVGWMGWAKNGANSGTAGYARRLEAIQIQVVRKGESINSNIGGITSNTGQAYMKKGEADTSGTESSDIPGLSYRTHVQNVGWQDWRSNGQFSGTSGQALRLEGININLSNKKYSGGIRYKTHVQNIGWQDWRYDGAMSGTSGQALRLEAINIELYGDMAKYYDIYYRVHAQDVGWMGWAKNGASSGTAGYARRLEGIQIVIVKKGGAAPGNTYGGINANVTSPFISR